MLAANLGLLLYREVSVMSKFDILTLLMRFACETVPTMAAVPDSLILWGILGTTRRRHANNDAYEINDFIGCEGDFPI